MKNADALPDEHDIEQSRNCLAYGIGVVGPHFQRGRILAGQVSTKLWAHPHSGEDHLPPWRFSLRLRASSIPTGKRATSAGACDVSGLSQITDVRRLHVEPPTTGDDDDQQHPHPPYRDQRHLRGAAQDGDAQDLGGVPEGAEVMWHHRAAFKDMMKFGSRTERWNQLDRTLATLATMAAAAEVGCSFCLDFGYFMAHNKGLDEVKAREVPRWRESDVFTPLERRVMEYAEAMCQTSPTVTDEMSAALLEQLGAPALVELTARVGAMNLSARSNVDLGIRSQEYAAACGLRPLATQTKPVVSTQ